MKAIIGRLHHNRRAIFVGNRERPKAAGFRKFAKWRFAFGDFLCPVFSESPQDLCRDAFSAA